jgi:hypothetical protein
MTDYMQRLLERLQTGWQPKRNEIDMRIPQRNLAEWEFLGPRPRGHRVMLHSAGARELSGDTLWIDAGLEFALCEDGFWRLGDGSRAG